MNSMMDLLLSTNLGLNLGWPLIDMAAKVFNIDIYKKIENKILANPIIYPELYSSIKEGEKLQEYLDNAIKYQNADFIKMLLTRYPSHNFELVDRDLLSPQQCLAKGSSFDEVVDRILKSEFTSEKTQLFNLNLQGIGKRLKEKFDLIYDKEDLTLDAVNQLTTEFKELLHSENDSFISHSDYPEMSWDWLTKCIHIRCIHPDKDMSPLFDILLTTNPPLIGKIESLIDYAADFGNVTFYQKIENKILENPTTYPELYLSVQKGEKLQQYLETSITYERTDLIKMILNKKKDFNYLNKEGKTIEDLLSDNHSIDDIIQALIDKKILDPVSLYSEQLSDKSITPQMLELIVSKVAGKNDLTLATLAVLNSADYSNEYKTEILKMTADTLFKNLPVDNPAFPSYLAYLINNWKENPDAIESIQLNPYHIMSVIADENFLNLIKPDELFSSNHHEAIHALGPNLFNDIKSRLASSFLNRMQVHPIPLSQSQLNITAPLLYQKYLDKIHQMIFIQKSKDIKKERHLEPLNEGKVIYNNNQYLNTKPDGERFLEGNPLYLDKKNNTPIGYNIHLPTGKVEGVMVQMYGGHSKGEAEKEGYKPGLLDEKQNYLLNRGIAVVTLNLPDLLKLDVYQANMPESIYLEIQHCIKKFHDVLKHNPGALHNELKTLDMEHLKVYLTGASFGGGMAVGHAELFNTPDSFDGYISHDGWIDTEIGFKSDLPILGSRARYQEYLNRGKEAEINKINKPILLMQNRDDNNVNTKVTTDFYKKMVKSGKTDLARLFVTDVGNAAPSDPSNVHNKGHFEPTNKNDFIVYCETILNFIKKGPSALPEFTEFEGYRQDKLANKFYKSGTLEQKFVAESVEIFEKRLSEVEALTPTMVHDADICHQIESEWEEKYKPLYLAMHQANYSGVPPERPLLNEEILRLKQSGLLTDDVIIKTLQFQSDTFLPLIEELYNAKLSPDVNLAEIFSHPDMIEIFRAKLEALPEEENDAYVNYFLGSLYKANPSLLEPLYPTFESNPVLTADLNKAKEKLTKTLTKGQGLLLTAYEAQSNLEQKNNVPGGPEKISDTLLEKSKVKKDFKL